MCSVTHSILSSGLLVVDKSDMTVFFFSLLTACSLRSRTTKYEDHGGRAHRISRREAEGLYQNQEILTYLYQALDSRETAAAASLFSRKTDTWIEDIHIYAETAPGLKCAQRKTAELMVKHRAKNLTFLVALRHSLQELLIP